MLYKCPLPVRGIPDRDSNAQMLSLDKDHSGDAAFLSAYPPKWTEACSPTCK